MTEHGWANMKALEQDCHVDVYSEPIRNGRNIAVVTHRPTGLKVTIDEPGSSLQNRLKAFDELAERLRT